MSEIDNYITKLNPAGFERIVSERRKHISEGEATLKSVDYSENILAESLYPRETEVVISDVEEHDGVKVYTLSAENGGVLPRFHAGQYICLIFEMRGTVVSRPFSLISCPSEAGEEGIWKFAVPVCDDDIGSKFVYDRFVPGTRVRASAPTGQVFFEPLRDCRRIAAVVSDSGICPALSLAKSVARGELAIEITIFYCCKSKEELLFKSTLDAVAEKTKKVRTIYVLTEDSDVDCESGVITAALIKRFMGEGEYSVFLYGSWDFYEGFLPEAEKLHLDKKHLRCEQHQRMKPHFDNTRVYNLTITTVDGTRTVPARSDETLLTALEKAGVRSPSKCSNGECGFCRAMLVSGQVSMDEKTDIRCSADRTAGYIHPCCTFPAGDIKLMAGCEKSRIKRMTIWQRCRYVNKAMSLIMAAVISLCTSIMSGILYNVSFGTLQTLGVLAFSMACSLVLCFAMALVLPYQKWAAELKRMLHADPGTIRFTFSNGFPIIAADSSVLSIIICFGYAIYSFQFGTSHAVLSLAAIWFYQWIKIFPVMLFLSAIIMFIFSPIIHRSAGLPQRIKTDRKPADYHKDIGKGAVYRPYDE